MKKQDWVDRLICANKEKIDKLQILESGCEYYLTAGKCNGKNGNCQSCPITIARRILLGRLPEENIVYAPKKPEYANNNTTVMVKVGRYTLNWKEV